jgi:hypothetical protein
MTQNKMVQPGTGKKIVGRLKRLETINLLTHKRDTMPEKTIRPTALQHTQYGGA